jgi:hypothetical protein
MIYICNQNDITMETTTVQKRATMFRFAPELVDRLKELARKEHRSLNNYVECVLLDIAYNQPNKETRDAIEEARSGKLRNTPAIDLSSPDAMFKSMGL